VVAPARMTTSEFSNLPRAAKIVTVVLLLISLGLFGWSVLSGDEAGFIALVGGLVVLNISPFLASRVVRLMFGVLAIALIGYAWYAG
jgi:hypothetical protein